VNTFHVYDKEFDNRGEYDPRPFEGLFKPGTTEAFVKMTGWGASDTLGHDCGPDRSAALNLGIREWDVFYHEWNHSLDWLMITSELGIGVPETHSSDWCGFEPISSMGMGHHSCNRYYMTPGMYRMIRGSDPPTTPHIDTWEVSGPTTLLPETDKPDDAFQSRLKDFRDQVVANRLTLGPARAVTATNGYLDFKSMWPGMSLNALAMASCYVYSPVHQRVRMWMGYDDNAVVFLNGQKVFGGLYWTLVRFQESREKDRVATGITLEKGWNHLEICVTNGQHGEDWLEPGKRSDVWGLSVRFCDLFNRGVSGLKWQAEKPVSDSAKPRPYFEPSNPVHYRWSDVAYDYTALLPHLTETDIGALLGLSFKASDQMWFITDKSSITAGPPNPSQIKFDNVLNWFFSPKENAAYVSTRNFDGRNWTTRELLFLRPEAYESYLKLMRVTPEAKGKGIKSHADRVIGYLTVPRSDSLNGRIVLVVDTYLGDKLPLDEEDLLDISHLK
jgi:hypothetical protein